MKEKNRPDSVLQTLRRIKALAERGVGCEAEVAKNKLRALLQKHGLTPSDLEGESMAMRRFSVQNKTERKLLLQVVSSIVGNKTFSAFEIRGAGGRKEKSLGIELTSAQFVDVNQSFEYYKHILKVEQDRLFSAFIQKHKLYPPPTEEDKGDEIGDEEFRRLTALMRGMTEKSFSKPMAMLEDKS